MLSASIIFLLSVLCAVLITALILTRVKLKKLIREKNSLNESQKILENKINTIELEGLKHKVNPHLFKNVLNSIQSHAYQTYFSLDKLSMVLDYILYESDKQFVSVKEEIEFARNLIEINKLKLSPLFDITVKLKINEENPFYEQELIVPMITIDLIENAFKHADLKNPDSFISITFELKDEYFLLTVANKVSSRPKLSKPNSGIGSVTLKKRLDIAYKDCYKLDQFTEDEVFISHLKINLIDYKIKMCSA